MAFLPFFFLPPFAHCCPRHQDARLPGVPDRPGQPASQHSLCPRKRDPPASSPRCCLVCSCCSCGPILRLLFGREDEGDVLAFRFLPFRLLFLIPPHGGHRWLAARRAGCCTCETEERNESTEKGRLEDTLGRTGFTATDVFNFPPFSRGSEGKKCADKGRR